jgi:hypothetical protein
MALIDTVPTTRVVKPSSASTFANGSPPPHLLRDVGDGGGPMLILPSMGRQAMAIAFMAEHPGRRFYTVGRGRSLQQQYNMLHGRYRMSPPTTRDRNFVQGHNWGGQWWPTGTWYNYTGAMVAVPGTSNHGWYCADDICELAPETGALIGLTDLGLAWLRDNGPSFGYGLETRSERWHWHWIAGDTLPQRAKDVLVFVGVLPPDEQPQPEPPPQPQPEPGPQPEPPPPTGVVVTQLPINKTTLDPAKREALRGNNDVALVQILCNGLLKSGLAIDKDYGPATQAAATTYQQISGVPADGVIGPVSWTAFLNSDGA